MIDIIPAAEMEPRRGNMQRMDQYLYNGKRREYQVSGIYQDPAALRPVIGTVYGISPEWGINQR